MKIGAHYRCAIPASECIRLLRKSADVSKWLPDYRLTYDFHLPVVRDDRRFVLGIISGSVKSDGDSSIIDARLIKASWRSLTYWVVIIAALMLWGVPFMGFRLANFIIGGWLVLCAIVVVAHLGGASSPFEKLRAILPPEKQHGFEVVSANGCVSSDKLTPPSSTLPATPTSPGSHTSVPYAETN